MNDRLYRSRDDRVVGGVCAGLADRLDLDPSIVRVGWAVLTIVTGVVPFILLYIVMLIVVPEEPDEGYVPATGPGPGAIPGWTPPAGGTGWATTGATPGTSAAGAAAPAAGAVAGASEGAGGPATATPGAAGPDAAVPGSPAPGTAPMPGWVPPSGAAPYPEGRAARRAERRAARAERRRNGDPIVALFFGAILVLLGAYFLLVQYLPELDLGRFWPVIVIALGVLLIVRSVSRPRPEG